jgi:hypothetical protein
VSQSRSWAALSTALEKWPMQILGEATGSG